MQYVAGYERLGFSVKSSTLINAENIGGGKANTIKLANGTIMHSCVGKGPCCVSAYRLILSVATLITSFLCACAQVNTVDDFISMSDATIRNCWEGFMAHGGGSKLHEGENTTNIVVLDIEVKRTRITNNFRFTHVFSLNAKQTVVL